MAKLILPHNIEVQTNIGFAQICCLSVVGGVIDIREEEWQASVPVVHRRSKVVTDFLHCI